MRHSLCLLWYEWSNPLHCAVDVVFFCSARIHLPPPYICRLGVFSLAVPQAGTVRAGRLAGFRLAHIQRRKQGKPQTGCKYFGKTSVSAPSFSGWIAQGAGPSFPPAHTRARSADTVVRSLWEDITRNVANRRPQLREIAP
ncbi:hypothetical protein SKAU_G00313580 [Synaphobranchus kaupii]|uniref:Uncharacterized protein n=1 Tax=Synaphobranchus kaupii TaxID=118154 RepID=A0A9Q1ES48_SYNKA|nr:hypothetical protein SKAU_G00313580 [Synaphobranchus kaupii]